jgi:hypothetical protein
MCADLWGTNQGSRWSVARPLRARRERPRRRAAAEKRNQLAAVHVASRAKEHPITSLNDCGVLHHSEIKSSMSQMGQDR